MSAWDHARAPCCRALGSRITTPRRPPDAARRSPVDEVEAAIVDVAKDNPTDGYRIVTAWVVRKLGRAVNRKRVLRVMREQRLIQRRGREPKRRRPGFFLVERPGQLWHLDLERHEALLNRAVVKGRRGQPVAAGWHKLGAA